MREAVRKAFLELIRRTGADYIEIHHGNQSYQVRGSDVRGAKKKPKRYGKT